MDNKAVRLLPGGDPASGMKPSSFTEPNAFTTEDKTEINHTFFAMPDESILAGVWECAPCREDIDSYPVHELMTVISGVGDGDQRRRRGRHVHLRRCLLHSQGHQMRLGNHRDPSEVLHDRGVSCRAGVEVVLQPTQDSEVEKYTNVW